MIKKLILSISLFMVFQFAYSQAAKRSGKVFSEKSMALVGALVYNLNNQSSTSTDNEGSFTIAAELGDIIEISYLGYETKQQQVNATNIAVILVSSKVNIDEIVVTALGLKRKTKDLGYSIQSLEAKEIAQVKAVNFLDNLTAKMAGVSITQGATGVGSTSKITIRGESSFTNNNPLFVIDGIPISNSTVLNATNEAAAGFQEIDFGNGAMDINPDDIASVSVLKGPSAAALYGSRASNGVIVVTTKDGKTNQGLGIEYNTSLFIDKPFTLPNFQNEYGQGQSGEFEFVDGLGGGISDNITYSWGPQLDVGLSIPQFDSPVALADGTMVRAGDITVYDDLPISPTPFVSNPDNLKDFYKTGSTRIHNLAISNGTEKGNYRLSYTDLRSDSYIPGVHLDRQTLSGKFNFSPSKKLKISSAVNYIYSTSDNRPSSGYGSENINYSLVAWLGRQTDVNSLRDYWQPGLEGVQQFSYNYTFFDNPYLILLENRNSFDRHRIIANLVATYSFTDKLSLMLRSGVDNLNEERNFRRSYSSNRFKKGAYAENNISFREINTDFLLNYSERVDDFGLDFSIGGNRMNQTGGNQQIQAVNLAQPGIFNLSNAASPLEAFQTDFLKRINSFYAMVKLHYKDFLFIDFTGRQDWSSTLATPISTRNTGFFYPSVSASFLLSELYDLPTLISFAKLRASWAKVGNDTDPYQTVGVFNAQTPVNGQLTFSDQNFIPNNNLIPEKTTAIEVGTDLRFFEDRLAFDISYYRNENKNQILSLPIGISSGYNAQVVNGGTVKTNGLEVLLGIRAIADRDYSWNSLVNFSSYKSTVSNLPDEAGSLTLAYSRVYDNPNQTVWFIVEEGGNIGDIWGTGYLKNEKGRFIVADDGRLIVDNSLKKLGNYNPDFTLGMTNSFRYKNIGFSFTLDWRQGGELVSRTLALAGVGGQLEETAFRPQEGLVFDGVRNVGTAENPEYIENDIAIPAESYYRQFYDRNHEENNIYDASYLKLREFQLSYTLGAEQLDESFLKNIEGLRLSLIGRNLFAFSEIPHFDPEQLAVQGNNFISGIEDMSYPTARSLGISLNVSL